MNVKTVRKGLGLSQEEFAKKLNLSRPTIARYELGTTQPPPSFPYHVAEIFKLKVKDLI